MAHTINRCFFLHIIGCYACRSTGGHSRRIQGSWPKELHGYTLYPPAPTDSVPCRAKYALQPILFFLPDLRYAAQYPDVFGAGGTRACPDPDTPGDHAGQIGTASCRKEWVSMCRFRWAACN